MTTQPSDWAVAPCPFCGSQPKMGETNTGVPGMEDCGYAFVECCVVHVHSEESQEDAIAIWNRRSPVARELDASGDARRAAEAGEWLPIESAPKDGTRIILGCPDADGDGGGISVCGYWLEELEDGVDYMGNDGGFTDVGYQVFQPGRSFGAESYRYAGKQPTHWQPLPAAPAMAALAVGGGDHG